MHQSILNNLKTIHKRINNACKVNERNPGEVRLLLATKTVSVDKIKTALQAGEGLIGENKVQELKQKSDALRDVPHESHFIGHLQTNKVKEVLKYVSCVQSLDRLRLAEKLDQRLQFEGRSLDVLVQVNTSGEQSKFGLHPNEIMKFVEQVATLDTLKIKGLMTIGLFSAELEKVRQCFRLLGRLRQRIEAAAFPNVEMKELSMGMSGDLETAIAEGATIVRVGTAIFGERPYADSYYWNEHKTV